MSIAKELIDADADKILRRLRRNGHTAYLVGGCVRDLLLGRTPKDFDIATSATPQEIKDCFRNCRIIGRRFRLAHIFFGAKIIETATFRSNPREGVEPEEGEELLIRRDNVFGTAEEDARRRDFTMNGLFYDIEEEKVTDYVGGLADLEARLVRTIGDPDIRFREDPVRILRAIKFAARLNFQMEPATYAALLQHRGEIAKCAPPRVLEEVYRLLRGGAARRSMELLLETGVAQVLAPELVWMFDQVIEGTPPAGLPSGEALESSRARAWRVLGELDQLAAPRWAVAQPARSAPAEAGPAPAGPDEGARASAPEPASPHPRGERRPRPPEPPTNALLVAALFAPFLPDPPPPGPHDGEPGRRGAAEVPRDQILQIEELLLPLAQRLRISRRDAERTRQILLAQRRLSPARRRRTRPMALVKRDYFGEALALFELLASARESATDEPARWRALWRAANGEPERSPSEPLPVPAVEAGEAGEDSPAHKRRRRRRGGRKRRRAALVALGADGGAGTAALDEGVVEPGPGVAAEPEGDAPAPDEGGGQ